MSRTNYRTCHTGDDAVLGYERTYRTGYYAAQWRLLEQPLLAKLFQELRDSGSKRLLDVACGQGRITLLGARYFDHVLGIDYSPDMLEVARHRLEHERLEHDSTLMNSDVEFAVGDVRDFTADTPFDVITAFRFFLNAEDDLRVEGLRCIRRNLDPRGMLITNVHVAAGSPLAMFYRVSAAARRLAGQPRDPVRNSISLRSFRHLLDAEGFEITRVYRYSLLPRIGGLTDRIAEKHINKIDRLGAAIPGVELLCQSFLVCARLKESRG